MHPDSKRKLGFKLPFAAFCERCGDELIVAYDLLHDEVYITVEFCERCEESVKEDERERIKYLQDGEQSNG